MPKQEGPREVPFGLRDMNRRGVANQRGRCAIFGEIKNKVRDLGGAAGSGTANLPSCD